MGDKRKILLISPCISYEYCVDKLVLIKNLGTYSQFILDDRINCPSVLGDYLIISGNISKCFEMLGYSHNILELNNVSTHDMNLFLSGNRLKVLPKTIVNLKKLKWLSLLDNKELLINEEQKIWIEELKNSGCRVLI